MDVDLFQQAGITPGAPANVQPGAQTTDLFQAAGINPGTPAPGTNPSFLPRVGADVLAGVAQMGNGLINAPHNLISASIPSYLPNYNYGQALGVNNPNILDKGAQGIAQYAPYMLGGEAAMSAKALESIPALLARTSVQAGTGATFGATQSQNPGTGAAIGAAFGAGGSLLPAGVGALKNNAGSWLNAIRPKAHAEQLMQALGGGNTLEGNAQSLAKDIQNSYGQQVAQGQALYKPVFDAVGNSSIYSGVNPANSAYQSLESGLLGSDRNLNNLHQQFTADPSLQNAHNLQSQLGTSIRKLQATDAQGNLSVADRGTMQGYQAAQGALKSDINNFLTNTNPQLANQYNLATQNWAQNVTPYFENSKLSQIAKGEVTNPNAIYNLFKNPEPEMQQVVNDIGPQANNKILYSQLGKTQANLTPEKLMNAYGKLDSQGISSYVTPEIEQQFEQLGSKINARNAAQTAGGGVLGAHLFGPLGAAAGAVAPKAISMATKMVPSFNMPLGNSLMNTLSASYRPALSATAANLINSQGGQ